MTAGPSGSKLAPFLLRLSVLLCIVHLKVNAIWICSQKQEELKDGRNRIQTTRKGFFVAYKGRNLPRSQVKFKLSPDECSSFISQDVWDTSVCLSTLFSSCLLHTQVFTFPSKISCKMTCAGECRIWKIIRILWSTFQHYSSLISVRRSVWTQYQSNTLHYITTMFNSKPRINPNWERVTSAYHRSSNIHKDQIVFDVSNAFSTPPLSCSLSIMSISADATVQGERKKQTMALTLSTDHYDNETSL